MLPISPLQDSLPHKETLRTRHLSVRNFVNNQVLARIFFFLHPRRVAVRTTWTTVIDGALVRADWRDACVESVGRSISSGVRVGCWAHTLSSLFIEQNAGTAGENGV